MTYISQKPTIKKNSNKILGDKVQIENKFRSQDVIFTFPKSQLFIAEIHEKNLIDKILKLRYEVFVKEHGYLKKNKKQTIEDKFDRTNQSFYIGAFSFNGELVGTMRVTLNGSLGLPTDSYFNLDEYAKKNYLKVKESNNVANFNHLVVKSSNTGKWLGHHLVAAGFYCAQKRKTDYIYIALNPKIIKLFRRLGFQEIGAESYCKKNKVPYIPIYAPISIVKKLTKPHIAYLNLKTNIDNY